VVSDFVITNTPQQGLSRAIDGLTEASDLRVWSVIVSVFGDLTQKPEDVITGAQLSLITGKIGLKPQAVRVALYRLRKDRWLDSLRSGRSTAYRLTARGFRETASARGRIYTAAPGANGAFTLALAPPRHPPQGPPDRDNWCEIAPSVFLSANAANPAPDFFVIRGDTGEIPDWLRTKIGDPALAAGFIALEERLAKVEAALTNHPPLPALDIACLRVLIVHHWRRVLLRAPALPGRFFPDNWPEKPCRARVLRLLKRLPRPDLGDL